MKSLDVFHSSTSGVLAFLKFYSQKTYFKPRAIIRPNMANMPPLLKLYSWPHIQENKSKRCSEKCREMTVIKRSVLFLIYHVVAPLFLPLQGKKKTIFFIWFFVPRSLPTKSSFSSTLVFQVVSFSLPDFFFYFTMLKWNIC